MPNIITEDQIEKSAVTLLKAYGYESLDCFTDKAETEADRSGRRAKSEVLLLDRLEKAARRLNPGIPESAIGEALSLLSDSRVAMTPLAANREAYGLIRSGIGIEYEGSDGRAEHGVVKVIDFEHPDKNEFLAVTQLWIKGERRYRRPDLLIYINGIPLVFIELKNSNVSLKNAYDDNLTNYRADIPALFLFNGLCVLSNALQTRIGSASASWEFFYPWLRPDDEREKVDRDSVEVDRHEPRATHPRPLPQGAPPRLRRELHPLLRREGQDRRPEPPIPGRQQGYRLLRG